MTFSIVARDDATGDLGVAVASKFLAVGAVVPWAAAEIGAIATQAYANVRYGPDGLAALRGGSDAPSVVATLTGADPGAAERQVGIVDAQGAASSFTGGACLPWAGGRHGPGYAVQGNILTGPEVVDAVVEAWTARAGEDFADRLSAALLAGDRAGGDARGRQSAALLVVRSDGGYAGGNDRWLDLRVDDHLDPVPELIRLRALARLSSERPVPADLLVIDDTLGAELRRRLTALGWTTDRDDRLASAVRALLESTPRVGTPRPADAAWDDSWDRALLGWMGVANLEERTAAFGWIDPAVLRVLRESGDPPG
jgi:uncharacterized Ntn-hydrolase superfamily protein